MPSLKKNVTPDEDDTDDLGPGVEGSATPKTQDEKAAQKPEDLLISLGAKFDDNDFAQLLLKGYYETTIDIVPGRMKAKMRTLLTKDYREVDELAAAERLEKPMTQNGADARLSTWNIAFGVIELNGKAIVKQIDANSKKAQKTSIEIAQERLAFFENMAPAIVNLLIKKHGQITWAINMIVNSGESDHLKNS
jgi:hypothetical protein